MNFKGFKKIDSDKQCTTLQHEDGHELKIAHNVLSKKMRKELDGLPSHKEPKKMAFGGTSGGAGEDSGGTDVAPPPEQPWYEKPGYQSIQEAANDKTPEMSKDTVAKALADPNSDLMKDFPDQVKKAASYYGIGSAAPDNAPAPASVSPPVEAPPEAPAAPAQTLAPTPAAPVPQQAPQDMGQAPMAAPAPTEMPGQRAPASPEQDFQKGYDETKAAKAQEWGQEAAASEHDLMSGHITPETYHSLFAKKDTLGKIGTIFGLMVSGAGAGLTHQPNALLASMNQEINNDLAAQQESKGNAQNLFKINQQQQLNESTIRLQQQQGKLTAAQAQNALAEARLNTMVTSKITANNIALHSLTQKVNSMSPNDPLRPAAEQQLAFVAQATRADTADVIDKAAGQAAMMKQFGGGQNGTMGLRLMGQDKLADTIESKSVPGIPGISGQASIPVPQEKRDQLSAQHQYDEKAREYVEFAKQHQKNWANLNPAERARVQNQGGAMAANLQSLYRNKIKGGVYKKGEQEFIEQIIPDQPAKWSASFNAIPKVEQTIHDNQNDLKNTAGSVGLKYSPPQQAASGGQEGATSTSKSGKPIVYTNGKWHYK